MYFSTSFDIFSYCFWITLFFLKTIEDRFFADLLFLARDGLLEVFFLSFSSFIEGLPVKLFKPDIFSFNKFSFWFLILNSSSFKSFKLLLSKLFTNTLLILLELEILFSLFWSVSSLFLSEDFMVKIFKLLLLLLTSPFLLFLSVWQAFSSLSLLLVQVILSILFCNFNWLTADTSLLLI